jgi:hypothetical protein
VTGIELDPDTGRTRVVVKLTATRGAYTRGETIPGNHPDYVVPRSCVRVRSGQYRIRTTWVLAGN